MIRLLVLALLALLVACVSAEADTLSGPLEESRDQGVLYLKKSRFKQAFRYLSRVYKTSKGSRDFRTVYYRGRAAIGQNRVQVAFEMALAARSLADSKRRLSSVQGFIDELNAEYGFVDFKAAQGEERREGRILLEGQSTIINKTKRMVFAHVRRTLRESDIRLPQRVYLPHGRYIANNIAFEIEQGGQPPVVDLFLQVSNNAAGGDSAVWWYLGIGGGAAAVVGVTALMLLDEPETHIRNIVRIEAK
jgi:hypothetical protein